jgi:hypothetical protein
MDNINHRKNMGFLRYKEEIFKLHSQKISVRKIADIINFKLAKTKLKVKISKSFIAKK